MPADAPLVRGSQTGAAVLCRPGRAGRVLYATEGSHGRPCGVWRPGHHGDVVVGQVSVLGVLMGAAMAAVVVAVVVLVIGLVSDWLMEGDDGAE